MYNLSNLNDYEFEVLSKDIAQREYRKQLRVFTQGKDGGIDAADVKTHSSVVLQAKKYTNNATALYNSLKKLQPRIDEIQPKSFYIFTSLGLSSEQQERIFELFKEHIPDKSHIWDKQRIDEFLQVDGNKDLVQKNFKLWLSASNILSLINSQHLQIDKHTLIDNIVSRQKLYVKTQFFNKAMQKLLSSHAIIIVGNPGVGKSTLSEMLVLEFLHKGYEMHYSSNGSISDIKKAISLDPSKAEVVYIDDCLGQRYMELNSREVNELSTLITYIVDKKSKYIILNSRIAIHNEAKKQNSGYDKLVKPRSNITLIDVDEMPLLDKAEILYNHLYFSGIDEERFSTVRENKNYYKIINHKNFNPRLIEFVTTKERYESIKSSDYLRFILHNLDNPKDIWTDEFDYRLTPVDRVLMYTIFSLTSHQVPIDCLKEAFENRLSNEKQIDTTTDFFNAAIFRLSESLIRITEYRGRRMISVANPSINDFISERLKGNRNERENILKSALFFEQYITVLEDAYKNEQFLTLMQSQKSKKVKAINSSTGYHYIRFLNENSHISDAHYEHDLFVQSLENLEVDSKDYEKASNMILDLMTKEFIKEKKLQSIILTSGVRDSIVRNLTDDDVIKFGDLVFDLLNEDDKRSPEFSEFSDYLYDDIHDRICESLTQVMLDDSKSILRRVDSGGDRYEYEEEYGKYSGERRYVDDFCERAEERFEKELEELIEKTFPIYCCDFGLSSERCKESVLKNLDIDELAKKHIHEEERADFDYDYYKENIALEKDQELRIDAIFTKRDT